jgi:hypothetical protein
MTLANTQEVIQTFHSKWNPLSVWAVNTHQLSTANCMEVAAWLPAFMFNSTLKMKSELPDGSAQYKHAGTYANKTKTSLVK